MFDLDAGKLIVIGIVALIAIPSKDLPRVLRQVGQLTGRMRRMAAEFQSQFMEAMREAELNELGKELKEDLHKTTSLAKLDVAFDPVSEARKQITQAIEAPADVRDEKPRDIATEIPLHEGPTKDGSTGEVLEQESPLAPQASPPEGAGA
jgi:sec-independent protein translocase protein TatB